jgi:type I restriction-modification system DNA methylase subunit
MDADEFRDYILGFIFYKYLAERMELYANTILKQDKIKYRDIKEKSKEGKECRPGNLRPYLQSFERSDAKPDQRNQYP